MDTPRPSNRTNYVVYLPYLLSSKVPVGHAVIGRVVPDIHEKVFAATPVTEGRPGMPVLHGSNAEAVGFLMQFRADRERNS